MSDELNNEQPTIDEETTDSTPADARLSTDELAQVAATEFDDPMAEEAAAEDGVTPGSDTLTTDGDTVTPVSPEVEQLVIQIGGTKIVAEAHLNNASAEQIKQAIADLYPEVKNAVASEATEDGKRKVQFSAQPGRKG